jgi:hypothetical protein
MVKCDACNIEMTNSVSCKTYPYIKLDGKIYKRNTTYFDVNKHCHDCGILNKKGNIHHNGCDMERCPKCKGQLISCDCDKQSLLENKK